MIETWILMNGERAISVEVETARSWWARFKGLMLRAPLDEGRGLYLEKTNSIHMCFMRFAIDAVYFDGEGRVVKVVPHLVPWLGLSACLRERVSGDEGGRSESTGHPSGNGAGLEVRRVGRAHALRALSPC